MPWASFMTPEILLPFSACVAEKGPDECWLWTGSRLVSGYGRVRVKGVQALAHRLMFVLTHGEAAIRQFEVIRHTCDNPPCVNPRHLVGGTHADNVRDKMSRGRHPRVGLVGSAHPAAKLTEADVREIRRRRKQGETGVALAREFGMSRTALYRAASTGWKSVAP